LKLESKNVTTSLQGPEKLKIQNPEHGIPGPDLAKDDIPLWRGILSWIAAFTPTLRIAQGQAETSEKVKRPKSRQESPENGFASVLGLVFGISNLFRILIFEFGQPHGFSKAPVLRAVSSTIQE
jgi:hypothetical protein